MTVAQTGSFSGAARRLGVRQSTVSRQVRGLEDWIGVSLFERSGAGVRPTDAGLLFLRRLEQIGRLAQVAIAEARDFGAGRTGRLRLGFIGSFASSPAKDILASLRAHHPGLETLLTELGSADLVRQVLGHELDCAWIAGWRSPDPVLVLEPLWSEALFLAVPASQSVGDVVGWRALLGQTLLARPEAELDLLLPVLESAGIAAPEIQFHDCSRESLVALVADGQGVAILPESFARLGRSGVKFARIDEPATEVTIYAIYRRDRDNPALRRLLAVTRDWLRASQLSPKGPSGRG